VLPGAILFRESRDQLEPKARRNQDGEKDGEQDGNERKKAEMASCEIPPCHVGIVKAENNQQNDTDDWDVEQYLVSEIAPGAHGPVLADQ